MNFEKWQALGNDYLIIEREQLPFELTPERVRKLCAGHFGVFADGILLLSRTEDPRYVAELAIFNPDGSVAELSGNGAREAILYLRSRGRTEQERFSILTAAGEISPTITGPETCRVDMGHASLSSKDFPSGPPDGLGELKTNPDPNQKNGQPWRFQHVSIGNPQCSILVPDLAALQALDLPAIGPAIEAHPSFPNRTNVSWYTVLESGPPARIRARIFERGVGETLSSGTGATGAAVAHALAVRSELPLQVTVLLDGGELLVEVGESLHVNLTGWARPVFAGVLSETFLKELHETE